MKHLMKRLLPILFIVLAASSSLTAFYNENFRWDFDNRHQFFFSGSNDSDGFKFSDSFDDLRSASVYFVYLAPDFLPFKFSLAHHIQTYRGFENTPDEQRLRTDEMDLALSYYFFLPMGDENKFTFALGSRLMLTGNLGGQFIQGSWHNMIGQYRPIPPRDTNTYQFMGFATGKIEYSWRDTFFMNADVHVSPLGDFFARGGLGFALHNSFMKVEATTFAQNTYFPHLKFDLATWWVAKSENGIGLSYRLQSDHYFVYRDIMLANWDSSLEEGLFYSIGGQGFSLKLDAPKKSEGDEKKGSPSRPQLISPSVGMRAFFNTPFTFSHSLVWVPNLDLPLSLTVGLSSNTGFKDYLNNQLFGSFIWDYFQISFFGLFLETRLGVSFDQSGKTKKIWRPPLSKTGFSLSTNIDIGFWFRLWHDQSHEYRLSIFSGITYSPLSIQTPMGGGKTSLVTDLWSYNLFGIAVEVRPFQPALFRDS